MGISRVKLETKGFSRFSDSVAFISKKDNNFPNGNTDSQREYGKEMFTHTVYVDQYHRTPRSDN